MSGKDPGSDNPAGRREFICLDAIRTARSNFLNDIVAHARKFRDEIGASRKEATEIKIDILRSENDK